LHLGTLTFYSPTAARTGARNHHRRADAFTMTLANYEFSQEMNLAVLFDMDYVVLSSGN